MKEKIAHALAIGCPLLQALYMIDLMVGFRYRANRHYWTVAEEVVIENLKKRYYSDLRWYGHSAICDQFCEYFELIEEA